MLSYAYLCIKNSLNKANLYSPDETKSRRYMNVFKRKHDLFITLVGTRPLNTKVGIVYVLRVRRPGVLFS